MLDRSMCCSYAELPASASIFFFSGIQVQGPVKSPLCPRSVCYLVGDGHRFHKDFLNQNMTDFSQLIVHVTADP